MLSWVVEYLESFCKKLTQIPCEQCVNLVTKYKKCYTAVLANTGVFYQVMFCLGLKYFFTQ